MSSVGVVCFQWGYHEILNVGTLKISNHENTKGEVERRNQEPGMELGIRIFMPTDPRCLLPAPQDTHCLHQIHTASLLHLQMSAA